MNREEIRAHAERLVKEFLLEGMESEWFWEDEVLENDSDDILKAVQDESDSILKLLAMSL